MSAAVKHTPGPWRVEEGTTLIWGDCNPDDHSTHGMGYPIAEARINPSGNWSTGPYADEGEANARLIAASPEMLEALRIAEQRFEAIRKILVNNLDEPERGAFWTAVSSRDEVSAAIAKATGAA